MFLAFVHCVACAQTAPLILEQPASITTTLDRDVTFSVTAIGPQLVYQWRRNGLNIPSGTRSTLKLQNVSPVNAGNYSVLVGSSSLGTVVTSIVATLSFPTSDGVPQSRMVKNIATRHNGIISPPSFVGHNGIVFQNKIYYVARDQEFGEELWVSDGTSEGTMLLKDINPGPESSNLEADYNSAYEGFVISGNRFFFRADDGTHGLELWVSDGTAAGTHLVKDIAVGAASAAPTLLTDVNGTLFFISGTDLYKSDGTSAGTTWLGFFSSIPLQPLAALNGVLYFAADGGTGGVELWKSDGTPGGTVRVVDINPGSAGSNPQWFTAVDGELFFGADDGIHGRELWKTTGTAATTVFVRDINPGAPSSDPNSLFNFNNTLLFAADDGTHGQELWKSDGVGRSTVLVADMTPGTNSSGIIRFGETLNGVAILAVDNENANGGIVDWEPWVTDGTAAGTRMLRNINTNLYNGISYPGGFLRVSNTVYFSADDGTHGIELWKTDGTSNGTVLVRDITPGSDGSFATPLGVFDGDLLFTTEFTSTNFLWRSDGTSAGTVPLPTALPDHGSFPASLCDVNGRLYFSVTSDTFQLQQEFWQSDGTEAGTTPIYTNLSGGATLIGAAGNVPVLYCTNKFYFTSGQSLSMPSVIGANPQGFVSMNNRAFFAGFGPGGLELWKTDGTLNGTVLVKDINPLTTQFGDPLPSQPFGLTPMNGVLYFFADDGSHGFELWRSDGTTAGTTLVKDIRSGSSDSLLPGSQDSRLADKNMQPCALGNLLFFCARAFITGPYGYELWRSDGTAAGTVQVRDIFTGTNSIGLSNDSIPADLTAVGSVVYFSAEDGTTGRELWRSDGTTFGTARVRDINPGTNSSNPLLLTAVGNALYFTADDGTNGRALWRSDARGTFMVKDFANGLTFATISELTSFGDDLYFVVSTTLFIGLNSTHSAQVWRTDGSLSGTVPVTSFPNNSAVPSHLTVSGGRLYFAAEDPAGGVELFICEKTPLIERHPAAQTVYYNRAATLDPTTNAPGLNFQWYRGPSGDTSQPLTGATNPVYITSTKPLSSLSYWLRATSPLYGSQDSTSAVVTVLSPRASWNITNFPGGFWNTNIVGNDRDPDGDGIANIFEFAFGLNPTTLTSREFLPAPGIVSTNGSNFLTITFRELNAKAQAGLTYDVQESPSLDPPWTSLAPANQIGSPIDNGDETSTVTFRANSAIAPDTRSFLRVKITSPP